MSSQLSSTACQAKSRPDSSKVPHPGLTLTMAASSTAWLIIVIGFGDFADKGKGMPYNTWWVLWLLVAITAAPVFVAVRRVNKQARATHSRLASLATFLLPPALAIGLLALAGRCANLSSFSSFSSCIRCGDSCPPHPVVVGWVWLWIGFGVLWVIVIYVLRTDPAD